MKTTLFVALLALTGCSNVSKFAPPNHPDQRFQCDMDPHRQGCERMLDYRRA